MSPGKNILAKSFASGVPEYKEIARQLRISGVIGEEDARLLERMAGYRNRLVHLYHEVDPEELRQIASERLGDISQLQNALLSWMREHPELVDSVL